ncbi:MAG TPA: DMT family transporter [Gaiellaceae bacterium]|nr:DMT family transporter [Gaiellaceae bacterium]
MSDEQRATAAFFGMSVLAGGNAVAIRFSNRELDPLWGAGLRFALAAALLAAVVVILRLRLPRGAALAGALLYGTLGIGGAFALAYYGLVHIHAGLGQTLLAIVPLATLFLAVLQRQERLRLAALVGGVLALAGIAVMSQATLDEDVPALSLAAVLAAAFCFAEAAILVRRFPPVNPVVMNAVGMATGALLLLGGALLAGEAFELPRRGETWFAIGYLVPVGSVLVFVLYLVVLRYWEASRAAYEFVLIPVFTLALSIWLDDEPLTLGLLLGGPLVVLGVYIGALRRAAST